MENQNTRLKDLVFIALMTAILCILAPLSVPIGPIPLSLATFVVYIMAYVLGWKRGSAAVLLYLLIGIVGIPVFSNYGAGLQKVVGPTGGYLVSYILLVCITGFVCEKVKCAYIPSILAMICSTFILYMIGSAWLAFSNHMTFGAAITAGMLPFIPGDLIKIAIASVLGKQLHERLNKAGIKIYG